MKELIDVRQIPGEPKRRWFSSEQFDLIVWVSDEMEMIGFELCYDKHHNEHSIVWSKLGGFRHMAVDDGEQRPGKYKASPILIPDGAFDTARIQSAFLEVSHTLPHEVARFVCRAFELHS
ncbi:MAG: hypothetical protein PHQ60_09000 [Sideroxydans sp.]|nr:hypothetical protein [Sideroxydans sp.]